MGLWNRYARKICCFFDFSLNHTTDDDLEVRFSPALQMSYHTAQHILMLISSRVRVFSYHNHSIMWHKTYPGLFILLMSYHAAQNTSWSQHQNIMTLPVSYMNKSTYYLSIFQIKSIWVLLYFSFLVLTL